jgi:hypothetical protein
MRTEFHDDRFWDLDNFTVITATIWEAVTMVFLIEEFVNYAVVMGPGALTYTKRHKDWFRHSKVESGELHTQTVRWSHKPVFLNKLSY